MAYIEQAEPQFCIFCVAVPQENWPEKLILFQEGDSSILLNKFPYNNGHLLIAPRRHVADLTELTHQELGKLSWALKESVNIIKKSFNPQGFNLGMNLGATAGAGVADHLHYHVVPRWKGDTNFMPVLADVRVIPEHLEITYRKLAPYFLELLESLKAE